MLITKILSAAVVLSLLGTAPSFAAGTCLTADDLSFNPALARAIPRMGGDTSGCVTPAEIARYHAAQKADRRGAADRIAALVAAAKAQR